MIVYGSLFVLIPLIRLAWQALLNHGINGRNDKKAAGGQNELANLMQKYKQKLAEREEFTPSISKSGQLHRKKVIFTTESETLAQQFREPNLNGEASPEEEKQ